MLSGKRTYNRLSAHIFRQFSKPSSVGSWSVAATLSGVQRTLEHLKTINTIEEFDTSLTDEQKSKMKRFLVYRSNPSENGDEPKLMSYYLDLSKTKPMYLDALIKIKDEYDPTLTFRRSCREGVCGSCAMTIEGKHTLACIKEIDKDLSKPVFITPLGHMFVLKDLVVDMTTFFSQYKVIEPYLKRKTPKEDLNKEYYQSKADRMKLDGLYECVLCASCTTSCPSYWWSGDKYLGPAVLMQAYRWIIDSRDEYTKERLDKLSNGKIAESCENIGMCSVTCPKHLNPQKAMQNLLSMLQDYRVEKFENNIPKPTNEQIKAHAEPSIT